MKPKNSDSPESSQFECSPELIGSPFDKNSYFSYKTRGVWTSNHERRPAAVDTFYLLNTVRSGESVPSAPCAPPCARCSQRTVRTLGRRARDSDRPASRRVQSQYKRRVAASLRAALPLGVCPPLLSRRYPRAVSVYHLGYGSRYQKLLLQRLREVEHPGRGPWVLHSFMGAASCGGGHVV